jgi:ABC-type multidrug transport system fused ATPase/permease subunit
MNTIFKKRVLILPFVIFVVAAFGFLTMILWNNLTPMIFHLPLINFWQALGLLVLTRLLFGGMGHHAAGHAFNLRRNIRNKWEKMTPDERERFCQHVNHHHSRFDFGRDGEEPESMNEKK